MVHSATCRPLAVDVANVDRVVAAALKGNMLAVVHQTRFDPAYQYVRKLWVQPLPGGEVNQKVDAIPR